MCPAHIFSVIAGTLSSMKVLVLGPGGREHAIIRALLRDPEVTEVHSAPGNAGIAQDVPVYAINANDPAQATALARELNADLVVIGPEAPLVAGVSDALREAGFDVFGPSAAAAQLEGSKAFAKQVMEEASVPTARAYVATNAAEAQAALDEFGAPYVVKDDGLAAGKGVVVTEDRTAALEHAQACFNAGGTVVIEEFLDGPEVSLFVISDGKNVLPLSPAQDFKRIFDNDEGPNTGGMGAYTPLPWLPEGFVQEVVEKVARPTVARMAERGTPFVGVLFCGLAVTSRGVRVIEFNARFGDPETQAVLARLRTPLNYPDTPRKGDVISGLDEANALEGVHVIHAGTAASEEGVLTAGGRVLAVVALGDDLAAARNAAYEGVRAISWAGAQYRTDIALKAVENRIHIPAPRS